MKKVVTTMTGQKYIEVVDPIRRQKGWSKGDFCRMVGVSANMYGKYANGTTPSYSVIEATEKLLGIRFSDHETPDIIEDDIMRIRQQLRTRPEAKTLFDAAEGAPASVYHEAAALFLRWKEKNEGR